MHTNVKIRMYVCKNATVVLNPMLVSRPCLREALGALGE